MAIDVTWAGVSQTDRSTTPGDGDDADNYRLHSIRNDTYRWTESPAQSGEYYLELSGGGDPSLVEPAYVQELVNDVVTSLTAGTVGSLAAGEWDWGNNDSLGFNTIYVKLNAGADPDTLDADAVTYSDVPKAGDSVYIPADASQPMTSGLDFSDVTLADWVVQQGAPHLGVLTNVKNLPLKLKLNSRFYFYGSGGIPSNIDLTDSAIDAVVEGTGSPKNRKGLYLNGSAISELIVNRGSVGAGLLHGQSPTITNVRTTNTGLVELGENCNVTTVQLRGGASHKISCNVTTLTATAGDYLLDREAAITTLNHEGGDGVLNNAPTSGAAIGTINHKGGSLDGSQSSKERTWTTYTPSMESNELELLVDDNVTITNGLAEPSGSYRASFTKLD